LLASAASGRRHLLNGHPVKTSASLVGLDSCQCLLAVFPLADSLHQLFANGRASGLRFAASDSVPSMAALAHHTDHLPLKASSPVKRIPATLPLGRSSHHDRAGVVLACDSVNLEQITCAVVAKKQGTRIVANRALPRLEIIFVAENKREIFQNLENYRRK
jgi:hypothetical protein